MPRNFVLLTAVALVAFAASYSIIKATRRAAGAAAPPGMVWIPGGKFTMGTDDPNSMTNERPAVRVMVDGFWIDAHDVTNAEFRKFVDATGYVTTAEKPIDWEQMKLQVPPGTPKPPDEKLQPGALVFTPPGHPVDLRDMSNWWTWTTGANWKHPEGPAEQPRRQRRLPRRPSLLGRRRSLRQMGRQALADRSRVGIRRPRRRVHDHARYCWGEEFRPDGKFMCNTYTGEFPVKDTAADGYAGTSPWNAFPPNGYGLYDMAGNVWQWTADFYRADTHALNIAGMDGEYCFNPKGPTSSFNPTRDVQDSTERVVKGGSFLCNPSYCESYRPTARRGVPPDTGTGHIGFRCVMAATEAK